MGKPHHVLKAPFLRSIRLDEKRGPDAESFPFSIPAIAAEPFRIDFTTPVTVIVGPNGSGKSTILEAIAALCGFGRFGGNKNYHRADQGDEVFSKYLIPSWSPKITRGFFTRSETFNAFIDQMEQFAREGGIEIYDAYAANRSGNVRTAKLICRCLKIASGRKGSMFWTTPKLRCRPAGRSIFYAF